jgi:hypothetical protein
VIQLASHNSKLADPHMNLLDKCMFSIVVVVIITLFIVCSTQSGRNVTCSSGEYEALTEVATICSLCNDSSVDYNEVRVAAKFLVLLSTI